MKMITIKAALLILGCLAMNSHAAPAEPSNQWRALVNQLEMIQVGMSRASLTLSRPLASLASETAPAPCSGRDLDGRCDTFDFYILPVVAFQADDVKKYHRDSADAVVKTHEGVATALDLVLAASENPDFGDSEKSALKSLRSTTPIGYSYLSLIASHNIYSKMVAGMSGSLDMGDRKSYKNLMDKTSDALETDLRTIREIIAGVKKIWGIQGGDGRYFTDLKGLDNRDTVIMILRDLKGHEKEVEKMAVIAGLLTRKTYVSPTFNVRIAVYLKDQEALPAELKKQWFGDDEKIVAVSLGFGQGTDRRVIGRYTLSDFQEKNQGEKEVNILKMAIAFAKAHGNR